MLRRKPANRIRVGAKTVHVPTATDLAADRAARRTPTDHRDRLGHERLGADRGPITQQDQAAACLELLQRLT